MTASYRIDPPCSAQSGLPPSSFSSDEELFQTQFKYNKSIFMGWFDIMIRVGGGKEVSNGKGSGEKTEEKARERKELKDVRADGRRKAYCVPREKGPVRQAAHRNLMILNVRGKTFHFKAPNFSFSHPCVPKAARSLRLFLNGRPETQHVQNQENCTQKSLQYPCLSTIN